MLRYLLAFLLPLTVYLSLEFGGIWSWSPVIFTFVVVPLFDLVLPSGLKVVSFDKEQAKRLYPLLYLNSAVYLFLLFKFLSGLKAIELEGEFFVQAFGFGVLGGCVAINLGHELGHAKGVFGRLTGQFLLGSTLYAHFHVEHNLGHHRDVGTPCDTDTALRGESVYAFWLRSFFSGFNRAWGLESKRLKKDAAIKKWINHRVLRYFVLESLFLISVYLFLGLNALVVFLVASLTAIMLLETVNYIEHYGLYRKKVSEHRYEDVKDMHSWDSNLLVPRGFLFELPMHSDHHINPEKTCFELEKNDGAGELPTGYAGSMILALLPPLWFRIMDPKAEKLMGEV